MTKNVDKQGVKKFLVTFVFSHTIHGAWRHMSVYLNKSHAQSLIEDRVESRLEIKFQKKSVGQILSYL